MHFKVCFNCKIASIRGYERILYLRIVNVPVHGNFAVRDRESSLEKWACSIYPNSPPDFSKSEPRPEFSASSQISTYVRTLSFLSFFINRTPSTGLQLSLLFVVEQKRWILRILMCLFIQLWRKNSISRWKCIVEKISVKFCGLKLLNLRSVKQL